MTDNNIPADVRQFIVDKIDSVPQLEALLLTWERPAESWTEETLSRSLYVEPLLAKRIVADLIRHGLVKKLEPSGALAFDSAWDPDGAFIKRLAQTYRTHLVRVATLIHSNASAAVRDFARAFDFKKD